MSSTVIRRLVRDACGSSFPGFRALADLNFMRLFDFRMRVLGAFGLLLVFVPCVVAQGTTMITLDQAINLSLAHNHALKASRTLILQNQAQEVTANLRPNPTLNFDTQFLPIFQPSQFGGDNLSNVQQFDLGVGYLFERGHKRQRRLQAAIDQTNVTRAQVSDDERSLIFNVAQQFITVLLAESTLRFAELDLKSFRTPSIFRKSSTKPATSAKATT